MPVFEYLCQDCGERNDILLKNREESPRCACGSLNLKKQYSAFSVRQTASGAAGGCEEGRCSLQRPSCASGLCGLH
ncbi:MAG TPA: zinc ribbon domain-containing protein [bacterium]|nr:zinc ribbon domain-containing protein [bacterium]